MLTKYCVIPFNTCLFLGDCKNTIKNKKSKNIKTIKIANVKFLKKTKKILIYNLIDTTMKLHSSGGKNYDRCARIITRITSS